MKVQWRRSNIELVIQTLESQENYYILFLTKYDRPEEELRYQTHIYCLDNLLNILYYAHMRTVLGGGGEWWMYYFITSDFGRMPERYQFIIDEEDDESNDVLEEIISQML